MQVIATLGLCLAIGTAVAGYALHARADLFTNNKYQAAAKKTAGGRLCDAMEPFYWEVGTAKKIEVNGFYGQADPRRGLNAGPDQQTLAGSAGAWLASAFLIEKALENQTTLTPDQIDLLRGRSPYTASNNDRCGNALTVKSCFGKMGGYRKPAPHAPATYPFYFGPGHLQKLAMDLGLGDVFASQLREEMINTLGRDNYYVASFNTARLFDGLRISPKGYARFLRDTMAGYNPMSKLLGAHAACAYNAADCKDNVTYAGAPPDKRWQYSIGHWVETDDTRGRGAFSAFSLEGYYVWISGDKKNYGIVAPLRADTRVKNSAKDTYIAAIDCGRAIREAFRTGIEQTRSERPCGSNILCWDGNPLR